MDKKSEKFILSLYDKQKGKIKNWNLTFDVSKNQEQYVTCFGLGYAKYYLKNEIYQECTQYVPTEDSLKISIIKL